MRNRAASSPSLVNCTFAGNTSRRGGALLSQGTAFIANCILWGNAASQSGDQIQNTSADAAPVVRHCLIEGGLNGPGCGGAGSVDGGGNLAGDPFFRDAADVAGVDGVVGTADDGLTLLADSLCLDAGLNSAVREDMPVGLAGRPRVLHGTVDLGAYEDPLGAPNAAPVAVAECLTSEPAVNASVTLSGALSSDPDGDRLIDFQWAQTAGPGVVLDLDDPVRPVFTPVQPGTYRFRLTVIDEAGLASSDETSAPGNAVAVVVEGDMIPPAAVSTLEVTRTDARTLVLRFTAVGDDGVFGRAAAYDLRTSTRPIDAASWSQARPTEGLPAPGPSGAVEVLKVTPLESDTDRKSVV